MACDYSSSVLSQKNLDHDRGAGASLRADANRPFASLVDSVPLRKGLIAKTTRVLNQSGADAHVCVGPPGPTIENQTNIGVRAPQPWRPALLLAGTLLVALAAFAQTATELNREASRALAADKIDIALDQLQEAAKRFPHDSQIQYNLGLALSRKGRLRDASVPLQKAAADPRFSAQAHFLLGTNDFEDKNYPAAITELKQLDPSVQRERVLYMLEESNRRSGRLDSAKATFHELFSKYPDSAWTHYLLGNAYEDQQDLHKAIAEYKEAMAKDPSIPNASFAIGYLYWRQQDTETARQWLEKEAAKGCHGLANYYLGEISRTDRDLPKAESYYRRSLICDSSNSNAHLRLGMLLEEQKRYPEALRQLKEATRLAPDASSGHYHLAAVYRALGRKVDANAEFDKVRQLQAAKDNGVDVTRADKN